MDPLSLTASVTALLSLMASITAISYRYVSDLRGASKAVSSYFQELSALQLVLSKLDEIAQDPEHVGRLSSSDSPVLSEMDIKGCQLELDAIHTKLLKRLAGGKTSTRIGNLLWPFMEQDTLKCVQTFQRYRSIFHTALSVDILRLGNLTFNEVKNLNESLVQAPKIAALAEWLHSGRFDATHAAVRSQRQEGTGQWFIKDISTWLSRSGLTPFFWCRGIPGAGKTVLTSTVIDHVYANGFSHGIIGFAFIYFNYKQQEQQSLLSVLTSIAAQLLYHVASFQPLVDDLYNSLDRGKKTPTADQILSVIEKTLQSYKIFLALDALDEASPSTRNALISRLAKLDTNNLLMFLTSRPNIELKPIIAKTIVVDTAAQKSDLETFVRFQLESNDDAQGILEDCESDVVSQIIQDILSHAGGMFLLVAFQVDHICHQTSAREMIQAAQKMPSDFSSIDIQTLEQIDSQSRSQALLARKVLSWLVLAKRDLTSAELIEATAVEISKTELDPLNRRSATMLVRVCRGLAILDEQSGLIRLAHLTVYDFLAANLPSLEEMKLEICLVCLTYLSFTAFCQGPCKSLKCFQSRLEKNPLFAYASKYFSSHILDVCDNTMLLDQLLPFAQSKPLFEGYLQALYRTKPGFSIYDYSWYPQQNTNLHNAATLGHEGLIRRLLEANFVSIDASNDFLETPILVAIAGGNEAVVKALLEHGASFKPEKDSPYIPTALEYASRYGKGEIVRLLLEKDLAAAGSQVHRHDLDVFVAVIAGDEEEVIRLLEIGALTCDVRDSDGGTALHWAVWYGHESIVRHLIEHGADIEVEDKNGRRAVHEAARSSQVEVIQILIEHGADIEIEDDYGRRAVYEAARHGQVEVIQILIEHGADIEAEDIYGRRAVYEAARYDQVEVIQILIAHGADIEAEDKIGRRAIHIATEYGHINVLQYLVERGVDIEANDNSDSCALHLAARYGRTEVVHFLLDHGARFDVANRAGRTPLLEAVATGKETVVLLLVQAGADINQRVSNIQSTVELAVLMNNVNIVRLLLDLGAKIDFEFSKCPIPEDPSELQDYLEIKQMIESAVGDSERQQEDAAAAPEEEEEPPHPL